MDIIGKVQETGERNLFVTKERLSDNQKDALIEFLKRQLEQRGMKDVKISKGQFVTAEKYNEIVKQRKRVVAIVGESLKEELKHKEGDRVLLYKEGESDPMLLANMAVIAAMEKDLESMKDRFRELLRAYYNGTFGEDYIKKWIDEIGEGGVIEIVLPRISPFVKAYYDALKEAREVIRQAA